MEILITTTRLPAVLDPARWSGSWLAVALLVLSCAVPLSAESTASVSVEYRVKAAFLFNFAQFVEWPAEAFADATAPLVIGVLGEDPFGPVLDETVRDEKVGGHPLRIARFQPADNFTACHILFVSRSEEGHLEQIAARLRDRSILTVSDTDGAARRGMMIRFFTENRKIRLKINLAAARAARLTLSSKLLRPAEIVSEGAN